MNGILTITIPQKTMMIFRIYFFICPKILDSILLPRWHVALVVVEQYREKNIVLVELFFLQIMYSGLSKQGKATPLSEKSFF